MEKNEVLPRFELGSLDSKSRVLTITPQDQLNFAATNTVYKAKRVVNSVFILILTTANLAFALAINYTE